MIRRRSRRNGSAAAAGSNWRPTASRCATRGSWSF